MEVQLEKIRVGISSKLPAQSRPANLLLAIDETLKETNVEALPTAYFASLLATLQRMLVKNDSSPETIAAILYLLGIVTVHTPAAILCAKSTDLASVLTQLYATTMQAEDAAPVIKSVLSIFESLFTALPTSYLQRTDLGQLYSATMPLLADSRPKVRKRAQDAFQAIAFKPADEKAKAKQHPYVARTAEWISGRVQDQIKLSKRTGSGKTDESQSRLIGLCTFVKMVIAEWPADNLSDLISALLSLPRLNNTYLTRGAYDILDALFSRSANTALPIKNTLEELIALRPANAATVVLAGWLSAVSNGFMALQLVDSNACVQMLYNNFEVILGYCASSVTDVEVRSKAEKAACNMIRWCLPTDTEAVRVAISRKTATASIEARKKDTLLGVCALLKEALTSITYRGSGIPHILAVMCQLFSTLRTRKDLGAGRDGQDTRLPTSASLLLADHIVLVGNMRAKASFEYHTSAEDVLGMACEVCGPRWLMTMLPLNLFNDEEIGLNGRAWLLPIMRKRITNSELCHFKTEMIPLSETLFNKKIEAGRDVKRDLEVRVYEGLVDQIWALLPGYCDLPVDLAEAFDKPLAELLSQILYNQTSLRPVIFRSLQILVEKNQAMAKSAMPQAEAQESFGIDQATARGNIVILSKAAPSLLSVMFNVFTKANRASSGYMLDCIGEYFSILTSKDLKNVHDRVVGLLKQSLNSPAQASNSHGLMDILVTLAGSEGGASAKSLYDLAISSSLLGSKDATVQKKAYRLLLRLFESKSISSILTDKVEPLLTLLTDEHSRPASASKKDRIELLRQLVELVPEGRLHVLLPVLSEAVLATKEANEKARQSGYQLVVLMAYKMQSGGTLQRSLIPGMEDSMEEDTPASLQEYFTMVAAGLTSTPHMISATVTTLARLLFEFHESLEDDLQQQLIQTMIVFLGSKTREVVKSTLGFVKVVIVSLPSSALENQLEALIPGLLNWSSDHKNHFNVKVRHILERLIRKFGFDAISKHVGEDNQPLMQNIRKRQLRAKRRKLEQHADEDDGEAAMSAEEAPKPKAGHQSAFDQAIQDSDSDISGSDADDQRPTRTATRKNTQGKDKMKKKQQQSAYLAEDDEQAIDLLSADHLGRLTARNPKIKGAKKPSQDIHGDVEIDFKGRLVVKDPELESSAKGASTNAYLEAINGEDGFKRNARGDLRANKGKKRTREDGDNEEDWVDDVEALRIDAKGPAKKRRREKEQLGSEFKAKKAGGDVSRSGQQPYAYVPLAKVGGKRRQSNIAFVGKGKKR